MALSTFTELKASVADWLNRSDLTSVIPDFVKLAEQDIERDLRAEVTRAALSLTSGAVSLPAGLGELRSVRMNDGVYQGNIDIVTPEHLADYRAAYGTSTGIPKWAAVVDGVLLLVPAPSTTQDAEIVYFDVLSPLVATTNETNAVLTAAPDLYLYGSLFHAAVYLQHDERATFFHDKYKEAVMNENLKRENTELGGSPRPMRLPVVFGE